MTMTNVQSSGRSTLLWLASLPVNRALLSLTLMICLTSCLTRREIEATVWLNNAPIPSSECTAAIAKRGFYRKLDSGKVEFVSFCSPEARQWLAIHKDDLQRILDSIAEGQKP